MSDVRTICAIGQRGQLGLAGRMPWEGRRERAFIEDVGRFFELTRGHVLIAGPITANAVPHWARTERTIVAVHASEPPQAVLARFPDRVVFVGGGPRMWDAYAPYIRHWDITRLPYDGEADRWFDPAWLVARNQP